MKYWILIFGLFIGVTSQAQRKGEQLKTMQIAFITKEINLTSDQAERFWPIFNRGTESAENIRREINKLNKGLSTASDQEVSQSLDKLLALEKEHHDVRLNMMEDLRGVISDRQVMQLIRSIDKFKKRMLDQFKRNARKKRNGRG